VFRTSLLAAAAIAFIAIVWSSPAFAFNEGGPTNMPWQSPLDSFTRALQGPTVKAIAAVLLIAGFIGLGASKGQGGSWHSLFWVVIAVAGAANVTTWGLQFVMGAGALL